MPIDAMKPTHVSVRLMARRGCRVAIPAVWALAAGCGPSVQFVRTECLFIPDRKGPGSVAFVSTFEARNLSEQQLLYHVSLERSGSRPVRAPGTQYRDRDGCVAASRSLVCLKSPWTFDNERVTIPIGNLGITPEDRMVTAVFAVNRIDGTNLATDRLPLPLARVHRALGNTDEQLPPPARDRAKRTGRDRRPAISEKPPARRRTAPPDAPAPDSGGGEAPQPDAGPPAGSPLPPVDSPKPAEDTSAPPPNPSSDAPSGNEEEAPRKSPASRAGQPNGDSRDAAGIRRHVVQPGETLSGISEKLLGRSSDWTLIYDLNRDQLESPDGLREGMVLLIHPDRGTSSKAENQH